MIQCLAYTRVSTAKQGDKGVSLQEQRAAIERYALRHGIEIVEWIEERLTAAKGGRPLFTRMLKRLRNREAQGVVIHKIDRSARNLRDWSDLGELIDEGISVHFANESVDLQSRGGRLSADIQAVVAADYIRNLREEALKGIYGRLKQGLYPFGAPIGYLDAGGGKAKIADPLRASFVRDAFELYASGRYTLDTLLKELTRRGLLTKGGRPISRTRLANILHNPFYTGLIRIRRTGEVFDGVHEPLIARSLFDAVQHKLAGRTRVATVVNDFTFKGLFHCSLCGRMLTGEEQKGHVYYRCHSRNCPTKTFREEVLEAAVLASWPAVAATEEERSLLSSLVETVVARDKSDESTHRDNINLQIGALQDRTGRLVDAFVDGNIDKDTFNRRKRELLEAEQALKESLVINANHGPARMLSEMFELASVAQQSYQTARTAERRELVLRLCSNRSVAAEKVAVEPHPALQALWKRRRVHGGTPNRHTVRTFTVRDAWRLYQWSKRWMRRQRQGGASL